MEQCQVAILPHSFSSPFVPSSAASPNVFSTGSRWWPLTVVPLLVTVSLSLSRPPFLSLLGPSSQGLIDDIDGPRSHMSQSSSLRRCRLTLAQLGRRQIVVVARVYACGGATYPQRQNAVLQWALTVVVGPNKFISTFLQNGTIHFQWSAWHTFLCKNRNLQVNSIQMELYFEVTITNSYLWWKMLSNGI